jgi:hypothetical protein
MTTLSLFIFLVPFVGVVQGVVGHAVSYPLLGFGAWFLFATAFTTFLGLPRNDGFSCDLTHPLYLSLLDSIAGAGVGAVLTLFRSKRLTRQKSEFLEYGVTLCFPSEGR